MAWYHVAQLSAFALVAAVSYKTPRAPLWAACLAASYIISVVYLKTAPVGGGWPPSQVIGLLCDGAVLILIREFHKQQWEYQALGTIMAFMVTADIIQLFGVLTGFPPAFSENNFGLALEVLNYMALALIGGIGLLDLVSADGHTVARNSVDLLHRARSYAHAESQEPRTLRKW